MSHCPHCLKITYSKNLGLLIDENTCKHYIVSRCIDCNSKKIEKIHVNDVIDWHDFYEYM